jgi:hypothetical protein
MLSASDEILDSANTTPLLRAAFAPIISRAPGAIAADIGGMVRHPLSRFPEAPLGAVALLQRNATSRARYRGHGLPICRGEAALRPPAGLSPRALAEIPSVASARAAVSAPAP